MSLFTDTVIAREVDFLSTTDDSLPVLLKTDVISPDAPFDFIRAYWPSNTDASRGVYVMRSPGFGVVMEGPGRVIPRHTMRLRVWWPIDGALEAVQAELDAALELLVLRIVGPLQTKTHGGRFLACAEPLAWGQPGVSVLLDPPERAVGNLGAFVTYTIDDLEQNL